MVLYFNPECSKCNEALDLLKSNSCEVEIRNYLNQPPSVSELRELVSKLGCKVTDIIRTKEPLFQDNYTGGDLSDEKWLEVLSKHPILIERPILISGNKAIVGRPPKLVLDLL